MPPEPYARTLKIAALALARAVLQAHGIEPATLERARIVAELASAGRGRPSAARPAIWKSADDRMRDRAKKLAVRFTDRPGRPPELVALALGVLRALERKQGSHGQLSPEKQWMLVDFIEGRIRAGLSLDQAAEAAVGHVEYPDDPSASLRGHTILCGGRGRPVQVFPVGKRTALNIYNDLRRNGNDPRLQGTADELTLDALYLRLRR